MRIFWFMTPDFLALGLTVSAIALMVAGILGYREYVDDLRRLRYKDLVRRFSGDFSVHTSAEDVAKGILNFALRAVLPDKSKAEVEIRLSMAGHSGAKPLQRFQMAKLVGLLGGLALAIVGVPTGIMPLLFGAATVMACFYAPDIWLSRQIAARAKKIGYQLPEALDLLQLCVRAGLGFSSGLQEVARVQRGAVAAEFSRVLQEMQFGMSRIDAFAALAERTKQPDLIRFAHAMVRADQAGITVSDMLAEQARSMREARQTLAREKAQQVSVKILFPLLVCFLPGVFIVVLGPAVLNLMGMFNN